ncbi:MAG TPA: substrate-binding domain-containing protein [Alphaproteobacteria bacterium]|nr:substrate-binding domain-containing protein [Alphaproteobacteria bacterium]
MTDVAQYASVSQSTVSVVLNGTPGIKISRQTRQRVADAVAALGYRHQKSLPRRGTRIRQIAMIYDQIATSPEPIVSIDGAREEAWKTGHVIAAFQTYNDADMEPRTIDIVLRNRVDAIIYATVMTRQVTVPAVLYKVDIPVVLLNCFTADRHFPSVVPGEVAGGHRATNALIEAGHQRIAHITGEMWMDAARDRLRGYREALATADIPYDPDLVMEGNWLPSAGYESTRALMSLPNPPTAIFCSNDRMAVGCYEALKEQGLRIPDDVSVIGYDDDEVARHLSPQLTTLVLPHRAMGRWAVEKALSLSDSHRDKYHVVKFECPLIERDSIGPPRTTRPSKMSRY